MILFAVKQHLKVSFKIMNFSKTTEYALRTLSYMSLHENKVFNATELSASLKIPFSYLRKQLNLLASEGYLESIQGKQGGFKIAKPLKNISLLDIIKSTDDKLSENRCFFGFHDCPLIEKCSMHDKWLEVRTNTLDLLRNTTLYDLKLDNISLNI